MLPGDLAQFHHKTENQLSQEKALLGLVPPRRQPEMKTYGILLKQDEISHSDFQNVLLG